jgi:hypothetical protein
MAINKVQFQRGLSMADFMARYGDEEQCEEVLMTSRWGTVTLSARARRKCDA